MSMYVQMWHRSMHLLVILLLVLLLLLPLLLLLLIPVSLKSLGCLHASRPAASTVSGSMFKVSSLPVKQTVCGPNLLGHTGAKKLYYSKQLNQKLF